MTDRTIAIARLIKLIESTQDESTRLEAAYRLEKIDPGNSKVLAVLVELTQLFTKHGTIFDLVPAGGLCLCRHGFNRRFLS
ncbi:hypothetical protein [Floridanema aerugineum]|uniref:Uncharacterized protein n=1 Tax=Floridaenema aerugineum BLCC-F46 TaxID=3153654 RepID=A0ABV4X7T1_9CYAN